MVDAWYHKDASKVYPPVSVYPPLSTCVGDHIKCTPPSVLECTPAPLASSVPPRACGAVRARRVPAWCVRFARRAHMPYRAASGISSGEHIQSGERGAHIERRARIKQQILRDEAIPARCVTILCYTVLCERVAGPGESVLVAGKGVRGYVHRQQHPLVALQHLQKQSASPCGAARERRDASASAPIEPLWHDRRRNHVTLHRVVAMLAARVREPRPSRLCHKLHIDGTR